MAKQRFATAWVRTGAANRVLQDLRASKALTWRGRHVEILDWAALVELSGFDPTYLNLRDHPR